MKQTLTKAWNYISLMAPAVARWHKSSWQLSTYFHSSLLLEGSPKRADPQHSCSTEQEERRVTAAGRGGGEQDDRGKAEEAESVERDSSPVPRMRAFTSLCGVLTVLSCKFILSLCTPQLTNYSKPTLQRQQGRTSDLYLQLCTYKHDLYVWMN